MRWLTASFKLTSTVWLDRNSKKVWKVKELHVSSKSELSRKVLQNLRLQRLSGILRWLVRTKQVPESKNTSKNPTHVPKTKNTSKNPKICKNIWRMLLGVATTKCGLLLSWLLFFKITLSSRKYSYLPALKTFTLRKTNWS